MTYLNRPFISASELFPHWVTAYAMLKDFCEKTTELQAQARGSIIHISFGFPLVKDEISGEMVPMVEVFPIEIRDLVKYICNTVMWDYSPPQRDLRMFSGEKMTNSSLCNLQHVLKHRELDIISCGGRTALDELFFRLGIWK